MLGPSGNIEISFRDSGEAGLTVYVSISHENWDENSKDDEFGNWKTMF